MPETQATPLGQALPQDPQLDPSVSASVHPDAHGDCPGKQPQVPAEHAWPAGHERSQAPQ